MPLRQLRRWSSAHPALPCLRAGSWRLRSGLGCLRLLWRMRHLLLLLLLPLQGHHLLLQVQHMVQQHRISGSRNIQLGAARRARQSACWCGLLWCCSWCCHCLLVLPPLALCRLVLGLPLLRQRSGSSSGLLPLLLQLPLQARHAALGRCPLAALHLQLPLQLSHLPLQRSRCRQRRPQLLLPVSKALLPLLLLLLRSGEAGHRVCSMQQTAAPGIMQ